MIGTTIFLITFFYFCALFFSLLRESCKSLSESKIEKLAVLKARKINLKSYIGNIDRISIAMQSLRMISIIFFVSTFWVLYLDASIDISADISAFLWTIIVLAISYLLMTLMEFVAFSLAKYKGENILLVLFPFVNIFGIIFRPVWTLAQFLNKLVIKVFVRSDGEPQTSTIAEDIMQVVDAGERGGAIKEDEAEMIESVVSFRNVNVTEVMTPRIDMVCVKASLNLAEAKKTLLEKGHSRLPVFDENRDDIVGVLYIKDMLKFSSEELSQKNVREIMKKAYYVPETKRVGDLLKELKSTRIHIAIVLDEYGGTAGLVTIEDIVEEIFGEIADEFEAGRELHMKKLTPNSIEVDGAARISEINEEIDAHLPEEEDYETITGFIFKQIGRVPRAGEKIIFGSVTITILDSSDRKIKKVRLELQMPNME